MKLMELGLTHEIAESVVVGMATSEYSLLLGAGFSAGAAGGDGFGLPSAWKLAEDLNDRYHLGAEQEEFSRLPAIYEDALHAASGKEDVLAYLKHRFTRCTPSWQGNVLDFDWNRIWTLNIDDVLDVASQRESRKWRADPCSHSDGLRAPNPRSGDVQVVHLHGRARNIHGAKSDLVFSLPEYSLTAKGRGDWLSEFWSAWLQRPFVVVGAKLLEEFDLAGALDRGTQALDTTGYPTVVVLRDVSEREKKRLERKGVLVLQTTGELFFKAMRIDLEAYFRARPGLATGLSSSQVAAFNSQFELLDIASGRPSPTHDFFAGDEPRWSDVVEARDSTFATTKRCLRFLSEPSESPRVAFLSGRPGAGKSAALLRVAAEELTRSRAVALFRGERNLDVDATLAWLRARPKATLLFDNAADYAESIGVLVGKVQAAGLDVNVVAAERVARSQAVLSDLAGALPVEVFEFGLVKKEDVSSIVSVRRRFARLGMGTSWSAKEWESHFLKRHHGDLFSALSEVEGGAGFYGRMDVEVRRLAAESNLSELRLLLATAIVHRGGYSLPIRTAAQVLSAVGGASTGRLFGEAVLPLVEFDRKGVRLRHRMLADRFIRTFSDVTDRYQVSLAIAKSLGVLVTPQSMGSKDYNYLILRVLMDQEYVRSLLESLSKARSWYAELEELFDWNGRYWDQRALLESTGGFHSSAYSYAKRSVDLHRHPFALTTLGTVRCRAAVGVASVDLDRAWEYFTEGNASLLESESLAASRGFAYEHPYVTFYSAALDFLDALPAKDPRRVQLDRLRLEWDRLAGLRVNAPGIVRVAQAKSREWIKKFLRTGVVNGRVSGS